jgi:hypothetical protein
MTEYTLEDIKEERAQLDRTILIAQRCLLTRACPIWVAEGVISDAIRLQHQLDALARQIQIREDHKKRPPIRFF